MIRMRDDMAKVIVERPRLGGGVKYPRGSSWLTGRLPLEDWHRRAGIRRPWRDRKGLNENLAPLRRYLRSQVGRPWDDVYGEVCQRIDRGSAVQLHIWQHLTQFVCTNPYVISGDVTHGWPRGGGGFYVDPRTGLLRENREYSCRKRRRRRDRAGEDPDRIPVDATREYRRIDGIWYEVRFEPLPPRRDGTYVFDVVLKKAWPDLSGDDVCRCYGRHVYAVGKRQLNTKEIRRLAEARLRAATRR
jgi:hypothetical protein